MSKISDEQIRKTREWAADRIGGLSEAQVIFAACDEALAARAAKASRHVDSIQRFHLRLQGGLVESVTGDYVRFADYERLHADLLAALEQRNQEVRLRQAAEKAAITRGELDDLLEKLAERFETGDQRYAAINAIRQRLAG